MRWTSRGRAEKLTGTMKGRAMQASSGASVLVTWSATVTEPSCRNVVVMSGWFMLTKCGLQVRVLPLPLTIYLLSPLVASNIIRATPPKSSVLSTLFSHQFLL